MALKYWDTPTMVEVSQYVLPFLNPHVVDYARDTFIEDMARIKGVNLHVEDIRGTYMVSSGLWVVHWQPEDRQAVLVGGHANGRTIDISTIEIQTLQHSVVDVTEEGVASTTYYPVGWEEERRIWVLGTENYWQTGDTHNGYTG